MSDADYTPPEIWAWKRRPDYSYSGSWNSHPVSDRIRPGQALYVLASRFTAAQSRIAALEAELARLAPLREAATAYAANEMGALLRLCEAARAYAQASKEGKT